MRGGQAGLTSAEARRRLADEGANETPLPELQLWRALWRKLWAPVPWMLEATIALMLAQRRYEDAIIIAFLLAFNTVVSFFQERRAETALTLLRARLHVTARALRDGRWVTIPAREVVRDDLLHVRMGDIMPADLRLLDGTLLLDQSPLTGESAPVDRSAGETAYAGALVKRGEASGVVIATGAHTSFGHTAELVQKSQTVSHLEALILTIVTYLAAVVIALSLVVLVTALWLRLPLSETLPFVLMLLVAAVPVALPATFTLAQALGAHELAGQGVLVTRLSAIEEAASMDLLCTDKTGTITQNQLRVGRVIAYAPADEREVLRLGALASDAASQDPLDVAILDANSAANSAAAATEAAAAASPIRLLRFTPFDPALKRTEALVEEAGATSIVTKGAPQVISGLAATLNSVALEQDVATLAEQGYRVLAVASGSTGSSVMTGALRIAGLIGLADPPRPDSATLIARLRALGVRAIMLTGDTIETARAVAQAVGIGVRASDAAALHALPPHTDIAQSHDVIAGIFPEDKYQLVRALQGAGHIVGMTGDGVNDAPALKQAEVGIAVASATDVAKAAASITLTTSGLLNILAAVETSRCIYQRMRAYTLNKIVKTVQVTIFLVGAFLVTRQFVITPHLIVLLLFANDFVTMSLTTDRITPRPTPERWRVRSLFLTGAALGLTLTLEGALILWLSMSGPFHLTPAQIPTAVFLMLVFSGQATIYVVRERHAFWRSMPGRLVLAASGADVIVVSLAALTGVLMAPVSLGVVSLILVIAFVFMLLIDALKLALSRAPQGDREAPSTPASEQNKYRTPSNNAKRNSAASSNNHGG